MPTNITTFTNRKSECARVRQQRPDYFCLRRVAARSVSGPYSGYPGGDKTPEPSSLQGTSRSMACLYLTTVPGAAAPGAAEGLVCRRHRPRRRLRRPGATPATASWRPARWVASRSRRSPGGTSARSATRAAEIAAGGDAPTGGSPRARRPPRRRPAEQGPAAGSPSPGAKVGGGQLQGSRPRRRRSGVGRGFERTPRSVIVCSAIASNCSGPYADGAERGRQAEVAAGRRLRPRRQGARSGAPSSPATRRSPSGLAPVFRRPSTAGSASARR